MLPDEDEVMDYPVSFEGECTCHHERDEHGWGDCGVDGCLCQAGWWE